MFFLHAFQLTIHISDENDNPPIFSQDIYTKTIPENVPLGYSVIQVNTSDADVGINADHTFTITGMRLSVYIAFKDPEFFVDFSTCSYKNFQVAAAVRCDVVVTLFMYLQENGIQHYFGKCPHTCNSTISHSHQALHSFWRRK